ncbi:MULTISPECIES: winged helix-turn-helix domain-containing protein [unclassified Streptomyces]|uniref:helix-turn-helix domain-containing protein n=1 Tax=unclassified Streptomyces TaxID=2593676 RepID=UPI00380C94E3
MRALASKGPPQVPRLSDAQFAELEGELARGPAAQGREGQRRTPLRITTVSARKFRVTCSVAGVWRLMRRHGWSFQRPARRALERDARVMELWKKDVWQQVETPRRRSGPTTSSRTSRVRDDATPSPHLGTVRAHPRGAGPRPIPAPDPDRGPVLLQARRNVPADLPATLPPALQRHPQ